jgi:membrane protease YdiL (CAAX protease family)
MSQGDAAAGLLLLGAILASLGVWWLIGYRLLHGLPVVPFQRRRRAPWKGLDFLTVFVLWPPVLATIVVALVGLSGIVAPREQPAPPEQAAAVNNAEAAAGEERQKLEDAHEILILLHQRRTPEVAALVLFSAVVAAPLAEELLFRVALLGWLGAAERPLRRRFRWLRRVLPGLIPVLASSALFAALHYRGPGPPPSAEVVYRGLSLTAALNMVFVAVAAGWLWQRGARWDDLGVVWRRVPGDVLLGALTFLAIGPPVLLVKLALWDFGVPGGVADPVALLLFAAGLGWLYYRTHRIVPAIAMHAILNGFSLAAALLTSPGA